MTMQLRAQGGGPGYAPYRDVAHNFPGLLRLALKELLDTNWTDLLGDYLQQVPVQPEDYVRAAEALAKYIRLSLQPETKSLVGALEQSGFFKLPLPAQFAVSAKLGEILIRFFYPSTRDAHALGEVQMGLDELLAAVSASSADLADPERRGLQKAEVTG